MWIQNDNKHNRHNNRVQQTQKRRHTCTSSTFCCRAHSDARFSFSLASMLCFMALSCASSSAYFCAGVDDVLIGGAADAAERLSDIVFKSRGVCAKVPSGCVSRGVVDRDGNLSSFAIADNMLDQPRPNLTREVVECPFSSVGKPTEVVWIRALTTENRPLNLSCPKQQINKWAVVVRKKITRRRLSRMTG